MKKILITNAFGPKNRGDHELIERLLQLIFSSAREKEQITILTTNPIESQEEFPDCTSLKSVFYRPDSFLNVIKMLLDALFWVLSLYFPFFERALSSERREKLQLYKEADLIVMCPGGYMYSNKLAYYVNVFNCLPFKHVKSRVIASPMSVGPFHNKLDYYLCKFVFSSVDDIYLRESYSLDLVRNMGLDPVYCHDLAWISDSLVEVDASWEGHYVGTVIDWEYPNLNYSRYKERFIKEYLVAAIMLAQYSGKPFILYNQVGGGGLSADEKLIAEIVKKSDGMVMFDSSTNTPSLLKSKMSSSKGLLASRFHSALFAIQVLTPFCSIAYQPKAEYILKDLNLFDLSFDISTFKGEAIAQKLINVDEEKNKQRLLEAKKSTSYSILSTFYSCLEGRG